MFCVIQDPYYDSETYRGDGGDGTGNWTYEKVFIFLLTLLLLQEKHRVSYNRKSTLDVELCSKR